LQVCASDASPYVSAKTFEELDLCPELLKGLYTEMKFEKPSRIQAETLPMMLQPPYRNLIAQVRKPGSSASL
jgi:ATP-dependent RNA helicase DDX19/DBP5